MKRGSTLVFPLTLAGLTACACLAAPVRAQSVDWSDLTIRNSAGDSLTLSGFASAGLWLQNNPGFGRSKANFDGPTQTFSEAGGLLALDGDYGLGGDRAYGVFYGGLAGTFSQNGINHEISNPGGPYNPPRMDAAAERYFAGWRSANLFPALGPDAIDLSLGKQSYHIGRAFLFWGGSGDCGERSACWIGPRNAFERTAVAKLKTHGLTAHLAYLSPDDNPHTDTRVVTSDLEYRLQESADPPRKGGYYKPSTDARKYRETEEVGTIGGGYSHIYRSDIATRDGMNVYDIRTAVQPLRPSGLLPGLTLKGEYVYEKNGDKLQSNGYYGELGYDFRAALPWDPYLSYRYAAFKGDSPASRKSQAYDPLFYSFYEWGSWFQGEIVGHWIRSNSNLNSNTVRLKLAPSEALEVQLLYFQLWLDRASGSNNYSQEVDMAVNYSYNDHLSFDVVLAAAHPERAAKEQFGDNDNWLYSMFVANLNF